MSLGMKPLSSGLSPATSGSTHGSDPHVHHHGEDMLLLQREISRLQRLERGLTRSSRSLTLTEGEEARIVRRNTKIRKGVSAILGIGLLVGLVFAIIAIVDFMKNKDVQFGQDGAGNTPVSLKELQVHDSAGDCWIVLHSDVYDLGSYSQRHPGGASLITDLCSKDGTELYDAFHRTGLLRTVKRYKVGHLVMDETGEVDYEDGAESELLNFLK
jgi:hypothetical protein